MFKTVKVGDTSLQYTIVSQAEDSSSSNSGSGGNVIRKNKIKRRTRHRQTVILILITLIMGCGIVIAAVLVPILVASKLVGNLPESAKFQTFAIAASSIQGYGKHDHNGHKYVELLPIKQAPVDSMIEFKEEIPIIETANKWPTDFRLNFDDKSSRVLTLEKESSNVNDRPSISNSSQVTVYYNKTENTTQFSSGDSSTIKSKTSYWNDVVRFLKTLIDLSVSWYQFN